MGKGKRVKVERKKQASREKTQNISLLHPFLQNYPKGGSNYLRRVSTKSGEVLADPQEWITLPKNPLDLCMDRDGITVMVNGKFQVLAIPVFVRDLSCEKGSYDKYRLVKGAEKKFAVNKTETIHLGTPKFYQKIESENPLQKDQNEGRIRMGKDIILQFQDPESKDWLSLPHEGVTINYDSYGYIYSCSNFKNGAIDRPEYDSYTSFNASPQRIAFALGMDAGSRLIKEEKRSKFQSLPEIRVFFGEVEYMDHEEQEILYRRAAVLNDFREDLIAIFTKTPGYSHQKEFRFFITLDNLSWDFESNPSLAVAMSPNFQCHFGYTYWADEDEQH